MSDDPQTNSNDKNEGIEREIRMNRKFSLSDAIAQIGGGGFMKGGSPISRKRQAEFEVEEYLRRHLVDSGGVLKRVLLRHLGKDLFDNKYDHPIGALSDYIPRLLASEQLLAAFVREADAEWGRANDERPYFQEAGHPSDSDDPYTIDSVRLTLLQLRERLASGET